MRIGAAIKKRRQELHLQQRELAELCSVSPDYMSTLENDHRRPSLDLLIRIASVLRVPPAYLLMEATPINEQLPEDTIKLAEEARDVARTLLQRITLLEDETDEGHGGRSH